MWQHSASVQQRVDADGNWLRQTEGKIRDQAIEREVEALDNREQFQGHKQTIDDHSTERWVVRNRSRRWARSS